MTLSNLVALYQMRSTCVCHLWIIKIQNFANSMEKEIPRDICKGLKMSMNSKISVDLRLQAKFFPHSLEGEAHEWFYALPEILVTSFRELSTLFLE